MFARERSEPPFGSVVAPPPDTAKAAVMPHRTASDRGAIMLDPKETKKGGFGAFAQRDRERREAEALKSATPNGATPVTPATPSASDASPRSGPVPGAADKA